MRPFLEYRKCCPHCNSTQFEKFRGKGFHLFSRFFCRRCKQSFFRPRKVKQITSMDFTTQNIESKKKATIHHRKKIKWF